MVSSKRDPGRTSKRENAMNYYIETTVMRFLLWVGLTNYVDRKYTVPLHVAPKHVWTDWPSFRATVRTNKLFYVFRNLPHVVKWKEGRLLPRRWGFGILGLIEIGDRGH